MAKSFLEKLNLLLEANLRSLTPSLSFKGLGKGIESELKHLHQQIAASQAEEHSYEQHIAHLEAQVLDWDQQVDAALATGHEAQARYAIQQMQTVQQRLVMAHSELSSHRQALYELMRQVSQLEAHLESAKRHAQEEAKPANGTAESTTSPVTAGLTMSEAIRQARESVQKAADQGEVIRVQLETPIAEKNTPATPIEAEAVERDLSARRSRLAKPE
jgi:chromosome segregation ATPase